MPLFLSLIPFCCVSTAVFGPPILTTYATPSSLHIDVTLPLGPKGVSIEETIINSTNGPVKTSICHTLKIISPEWAERVSQHHKYTCLFVQDVRCVRTTHKDTRKARITARAEHTGSKLSVLHTFKFLFASYSSSVHPDRVFRR